MRTLRDSRPERLFMIVAALALLGLGLARPAAARPFPEIIVSSSSLLAATAPNAPQITVSAPANVAPGAAISATATALAGVASISVGYCPGWTCSTPLRIATASWSWPARLSAFGPLAAT